ncbi:MAG: hypothetical protein R3C10_20090 [Pirellulales bacterium]
MTHLRLHQPEDEDDSTSPGSLRLHGGCAFVVYPSYCASYFDTDGLVSALKKTRAGRFRFWEGFAGGGVLELIDAESDGERWRPATGNYRWCSVERIDGLNCGNRAGEDLASYVAYALPDFPPPIAVKMGLADRPPKKPTIGVSAEHIDGLSGERFCLVVPRQVSKVCKHQNSAIDWFGALGIKAKKCPLSGQLTSGIAGWYDRSLDKMLVYQLSGGEENAAWQLAATSYVATHWWTKWRGLESVHLLADIQGKPVFRPNWTNPMYR